MYHLKVYFPSDSICTSLFLFLKVYLRLYWVTTRCWMWDPKPTDMQWSKTNIFNRIYSSFNPCNRCINLHVIFWFVLHKRYIKYHSIADFVQKSIRDPFMDSPTPAFKTFISVLAGMARAKNSFKFKGQQCRVGNLLCTAINRYGFPGKCTSNLFSHSSPFKQLPSSHWNLCVSPISNFTMFCWDD